MSRVMGMLLDEAPDAGLLRRLYHCEVPWVMGHGCIRGVMGVLMGGNGTAES